MTIKAALRVGIIGANAETGWARFAHVPAIEALEGIALTAVATTRIESARAAADAFGAGHAFDSAEALAGCDDIDIIAVSVKAPKHYETVMSVVGAGKPLFCEWPLGANADQSQAMADAAAAAGIRTFVGLQARAAPPVLHARRLVRDGSAVSMPPRCGGPSPIGATP